MRPKRCNAGGRAPYAEGKICDHTTLLLSNRTSALMLLPMGVVSVGPRGHAHPEPIPISSSLDHALETRTPKVLDQCGSKPPCQICVASFIPILPKVGQAPCVLVAREPPFGRGVDGVWMCRLECLYTHMSCRTDQGVGREGR